MTIYTNIAMLMLSVLVLMLAIIYGFNEAYIADKIDLMVSIADKDSPGKKNYAAINIDNRLFECRRSPEFK